MARGFCYKPRKSIGKVAAPVAPPKTVDYDLWSGPRKKLPIRRQQFHYDWHWQSPYGNGDLGNQGPHQLDVCRWALGDPMKYPELVLTAGGRFGYDDDGETANTQVVYARSEGQAPILFEVRGLPKEGLDWKKGMPDYEGVTVGNVIEYEGGKIIGGHTAKCHVVDSAGKIIKEFQGSGDAIGAFIDDVLTGKQEVIRGAKNGHYSSAIAHLGTHALSLGNTMSQGELIERSARIPAAQDAVKRMSDHLRLNGLASIEPTAGVILTTDGKQVIGEHAAAVAKLDREHYREGFQLPNA
jgi:hypothetical protein